MSVWHVGGTRGSGIVSCAADVWALARPGSGGVLWCYVSLGFCVDGRSRYLYIALDGYLRILGAPSVQSCCTLWISASYRVFLWQILQIQTCLCVVVGPGIVTHFYEEQHQPSRESAWSACPQNGKSGPHY